MYIEFKGGGLEGEARIGRVSFSKTGKTLRYKGRSFSSLKGQGYKANYADDETGDYFWISGPRKDGCDPLYPNTVFIDEDVRDEYWSEIRNEPNNAGQESYRSNGKYTGRGRGASD